MKVLHTIPRLKLSSGGPPLSTSLTVLGIRAIGVDAEIATYQLESSKDTNIIEGDFIHFLPSPREKVIAYSGFFAPFLRKSTYDLYHCQGVWQYPSLITAKIAREFKKPYVITPRGMLYPQEMKKSKVLKMVFWNLFLKRDLQKAACIHATCIEEMNHLRTMGITSPIAVIPNPIATPTNNRHPINAAKTTTRFGYLGRIHARKNIDRLIHAWANLGSAVNDCELVIIGAGDSNHHDFLKKEVERLKLNNVVFTGFVIGADKEELISSLSYLVVPSDFENFGMIVAEALAYKVPVIASKGTPWEELETQNCGWWIDNDINTIQKTIVDAINLPEDKRIKMGENGRQLIEEKYSTSFVATRIVQLYSWILGSGTKPDFVYIA